MLSTKCMNCGCDIRYHSNMCLICGRKIKKPFYAKAWVWIGIIIFVSVITGRYP